MKFFFLLSLLLCLLIQACSKDNDNVVPRCDDCDFTCIEEGDTDNVFTNECRDNWECEYTILLNSQVDIDDYLGAIPGDKTVFQLVNSTDGSQEIIDDEDTHILVFELDSTLDSFSVVDESMITLDVQFKTVCFCSYREFVTPSSGCLQGKKQEDGRWYIQGNLEFIYSDNTSFNFKVEARYQE